MRQRLLSAAEEVALARRIERGDLDAKERMITSNLRLVISIARRFQGVSELALPDLIQEGALGLIRAVEKFDWRRGVRFSTYATPWITQAIVGAMDNRGRTIRLPVSVAQRERRIAGAERELATRLGRDPSVDEIAEQARVRPGQVEELRNVARKVTSLERHVGETGTELMTLFASEDPPPEERVEVSLRREAVRAVVDRLPEPQRAVIRLRFGLDGGRDPLTLDETARRLLLSTAQIRALQRHALADLAARHELAA